jgi:hypothetical protein
MAASGMPRDRSSLTAQRLGIQSHGRWLCALQKSSEWLRFFGTAKTNLGLVFAPPFVTNIAGEHMPAFCARWPDGSFSIVDADDETHALIQLDELGDEPAQLWQLQSCLLDFELTDSGTFRIREFGEETGSEIMERAYPVLNKALAACV